jgi:long-chain acyl-CoA synthetase
MERVWFASYDAKVPRSLEMPQKALPFFLESNAAQYSTKTATEFFGAKLTYGELWHQILSFSNGLRRLGVAPGTRVAVMLPNCPQTVIAFYATLWIGGVVVMTNPMYVEREMEHQWKDSEAEVLVVLDHLYPKVKKVLPGTRIRTVIVTSIKDYLPFPLRYLYPIKAWKQKLFTAVPYSDTTHRFTDLVHGNTSDGPGHPVKLDDLALLQYTGGTTGLAKGVMLTHRNILANVLQLAAWFSEMRYGQERFLSILPFFHVFGMSVCLNLPIYSGSAMILVPRFEVGQFLKILHKSKPTLFPGVPTLFIAIVNHPRIHSYDLSSIRYCITGSAPMPVEVLRKFEELTGSVIIEGYGLTESSPVTHANPLQGVRKVGSIGIPLPDTDARVVDMDLGAREMPAGEPGELIVKGPQVMKGYWKMDSETAIALRDGWLYTGDIATMDEAGYVFIVDRKKDMIIAGGYNVYPREIEEVLYEHPKVLDTVSIGVPHAYRGETVKVFVVPKPGVTLTEQEIMDYCKSKLAAYKVPKMVEIRESLPKSIVGKILRKDLRREELQRMESSPDKT